MENMVISSESSHSTALGRLLLGLVVGVILLVPLVAVLANVQLGPALRTYDLSLTDGNILREPRPVENRNYERLAQDERLTVAVNYTLRLVGGRVVAVTLFPVIIGLLVGVQGMVGRMVNRVLLGLLTVTAAPIVMIMLWRLYWLPVWGNQPSPVFPPPDNLLLTTLDGAQNALLRLDNTITLAIAMIALVVIYAAVVRGWRKGRLSAALQAGVGAWLISLLLAAFSGLQVFALPMLLTEGGPLNSTNTVMLDMYTTGFRYFRLGLGAAEAVYLIVAALVVGFLVWLVTVAFRLRLSFTPPAQIHRRASLLSLVTIPALLIVAYPLLTLILWGNGQAATNGVDLKQLDNIDFAQARDNTQSVWLAIWLIHLPVTYLAGLALGFVRPLGRIVSNLLFLPLLLLAFLPAESLIFAWFIDTRDAQMLNTTEWLNVPWLVGGLALLVFKLFFDGAHERYMRARQHEEIAPAAAFLHQVLLPSLPVLAAVGVMITFASTQDFLWPLGMVTSPDTMPLSVVTAVLSRVYSGSQSGSIVSFVMAFFGMLAWFAVPFVLLQVLVFDRLALLGGKTDYSVYEEPAAARAEIQLEG